MKSLPTEAVAYLRAMISPEHLDECVSLYVCDPGDFHWAAHADASVHALLIEGDGDEEAWMAEAYRVLKPGAHLLLASPEAEPTGHTAACQGEDIGFEVRDCILLAEAGTPLHYVPKPSRAEREAGCGTLSAVQRDDGRKEGNPGGDNPRNRGVQKRHNSHPTVKPVEIMRRLLLGLPMGAPVVDPFLGSGTTMIACTKTGHDGIGIEREEAYLEIAENRVSYWNAENQGWNRAAVESDLTKEPDAATQSLEDFFGLG